MKRKGVGIFESGLKEMQDSVFFDNLQKNEDMRGSRKIDILSKTKTVNWEFTFLLHSKCILICRTRIIAAP